MSSPHRSFRRIFAGVAALLLPGVALAHPATGHVAGFVAGFAHPFGGVDHLLAMGAVGLVAASLEGRARWIVPLAFIGFMLAGAALGAAGVVLPFVEAGIALSLVALGGVLALGWRPSLAWAGALAALFAFFHGHAHGSEMPVDASGMAYALGFTLASGAIIAGGLALGRAAITAGPRVARLVRLGGALIAATGLGLLFAG